MPDAIEIGAKLARDLMALGDGGTKAHRIEFKGGEWPHHEIAQGGMNEAAPARFFAGRLSEYLTAASVMQPKHLAE